MTRAPAPRAPRRYLGPAEIITKEISDGDRSPVQTHTAPPRLRLAKRPFVFIRFCLPLSCRLRLRLRLPHPAPAGRAAMRLRERGL